MIQLTNEQAHAYAQMYLYLRESKGSNSDRPRIVNLFRSQLYSANTYQSGKADAQIVQHMLDEETNQVAFEIRNDFSVRYTDEEFDEKWPGVLSVYRTRPKVQVGAQVIIESDYWISDDFTTYCIKIAKERLAAVGVNVDSFGIMEDNNA